MLDATRRTFLQQGLGLGAIALGALDSGAQAQEPVSALAPKAPPLPAKVKRVLYLSMSGAPPQHDMFDPKPQLDALDGTPCPAHLFEGKRLAFIKGRPKLLGSPHKSSIVDALGVPVTDLMPGFREYAKDVCLVRSLHTDQFNHAPAEMLLYTGNPTIGKPSLGTWTTWGLGSINQDLPGYVVLVSGGSDPTGGKSLWSSGFLPSEYQGVRLRSKGDPVLYVSDPKGLERPLRRRMLDALRTLNEEDHARHQDPETLARIEQYELAYRMQMAVPEVTDLSKESTDTLERYGAQPGEGSFANNCLLARNLLENGVRFVQLFDWGWDLHGTNPGDDLITMFPKKCGEIDQPIAALMRDLSESGLLEDTLVIWGGEFGRTPMLEARGGSKLLGRDHQPDCFTVWLAGGGVKAGHVHGSTDDLGAAVHEDGVSVRDLQATVLHLLGFDAEEMRFPHQGLDQRLIGPADGPRVAGGILS
ncbi:MAG: sulfatase [Deltaproteobacteria bacterium]|nr:MAG: sulfatase [Deltaproteobacteria bacterium]